jgi:type II secretory pathway pseudopilin PulG
MLPAPPTPRCVNRQSSIVNSSGFTMVEIALCLAIIGFALVAIIGVLPTGLNVQKENREETIIDQDVMVWMNAIRNGSQGIDDLTNYVISITNYVWAYEIKTEGDVVTTNQLTQVGRLGPAASTVPEVDVFTPAGWLRNGQLMNDPPYALTNGLRIIGILSRPRIEWANSSGTEFFSNYIVANIRSISGSVVDKYPQTNQVLLGSGFDYRMIPEVGANPAFDPNSINFSGSASTNAVTALRQSTLSVVNTLRTNAHDLRLTFRWPLLPSGDAGLGRQTFRLLTGGQLCPTNDLPNDAPFNGNPPYLYFLQPSIYVQAQ